MVRKQGNSRRNFIAKCIGACSVLLTGTLLWSACEKKNSTAKIQKDAGNAVDPCSDLSEVSENDIAVREKLGYVKESPIADNQCQNCNLYLPPNDGQPCGGCMLFKGPVYASAYCTYWAPKI